MLAWCSICVIRTASPGPTFARPHAYATRLIASVAFLVKIVVSRCAPVKAATRARAWSKAASASCASAYTPRCTFALWAERCSCTASMTTCGFCEVEAESRYTSGCPPSRRAKIGKSARTPSELSATCGIGLDVLARGRQLSRDLLAYHLGKRLVLQL